MFVRFDLYSGIFKIQNCRKSQMGQMISEGFWTLKYQNNSVFTKYVLLLAEKFKITLYALNMYYPWPKSFSVWPHNQPFTRHKGVGNQKCIEWPHNDINI